MSDSGNGAPEASQTAPAGMERWQHAPSMPSREQYEDYDDFARKLLASGPNFVKKGITTPEQALVLMMAGREIGLGPIASLQDIYVVNGKPSLETQGMMALLDGRPDLGWYDVDVNASSDTIGVVHFHKRMPNGTIRDTTYTYTAEQAQRAGVWGKEGPWKAYREIMLIRRAFSTGFRFEFPGLLRGISAYDPEELGVPMKIEGSLVVVDDEKLAAGELDDDSAAVDRHAAEEAAGLAPDPNVKDVDFEEAPVGAKPIEPEVAEAAEAEDKRQRTIYNDLFDLTGDLMENIGKPEDGLPKWAVDPDPVTSRETQELIERVGVPKEHVARLKRRLADDLYTAGMPPASEIGPDDHRRVWSLFLALWDAGKLPAVLFEALLDSAGVPRPEFNPFLPGVETPEPEEDAPDDAGL